MNCPSCGHSCPPGAAFCEACGARLQADQAGAESTESARQAPRQASHRTQAQPPAVEVEAKAVRQTVRPPVSEEMKSFARYQQSLLDMSRSVRAAKQDALDMEDAHAYYKKVMRNCLLVEIILFVATSIGLATTSDEMLASAFASDDLSEKVGTALAFGLLSVSAFFFPFGFTPLKNFVADHGIFVVASLLFMLIALMIALCLAVLIGLPYMIWLIHRIRATGRMVQEAHAYANDLEAHYQHM